MDAWACSEAAWAVRKSGISPIISRDDLVLALGRGVCDRGGALQCVRELPAKLMERDCLPEALLERHAVDAAGMQEEARSSGLHLDAALLRAHRVAPLSALVAEVLPVVVLRHDGERGV